MKQGRDVSVVEQYRQLDEIEQWAFRLWFHNMLSKPYVPSPFTVIEEFALTGELLKGQSVEVNRMKINLDAIDVEREPLPEED